LLNHPDVYKKNQPGIKYIMVDEYKDTIYIQEQILVKLAHPENNLCVAEEDQTIYRFRAATVRNILEFAVVFVGFLNKNFLVQKEEDRYLLPFSKRGAFETEERMTQFDRIRHYYVAFSRAQNLLVLKTSGNPNDWFEPNFSLVSLMNQSFRSNTHFPKKLFRFPRKKRNDALMKFSYTKKK
jgi:superfamily I DNA/RNA helicase